MIVCFAAPFTNAAETVLQFVGSSNSVLATFTGHRKANADVICSANGQWTVANSAGTLVPFTSLTCSQETLFTNDNLDVDDIFNRHGSHSDSSDSGSSDDDDFRK